MTDRHFGELLNARWNTNNFLCVGLDPEYGKIPASVRTADISATIGVFDRAIIDATKDIACAFKPNSAFYEAHGADGIAALREMIQYIHATAPEVPVILDIKRADIGNTNSGYVASAFEYLGADAVTLHPYLGREAVQPFLDQTDKGIFILCRTSNAGSGEFQNLMIDGEPLYQHVARSVATEWNKKGNCGLVVGATYPEEIARVREVAPSLPFLIPGVGAQGGDLEKSVAAAKDAQGRGFIISVSRAILFASMGADFAEAAAVHAHQLDSAIRAAL